MPQTRITYVTYLDRPKELINFKFVSAAGKELTLKKSSKNKKTVLIFWSLNCKTCVEHLGDYNQLVQAGQKRGKSNYILLSCDTWEEWAKAHPGGLETFTTKAGIDIPLYALAEGERDKLSKILKNFKTPEYHEVKNTGEIGKRFVLNDAGLEEAWNILQGPTKSDQRPKKNMEVDVMELDKPTKVINLNLIKTERAGGEYKDVGRLKTMRINNGKPTIVVTWVSSHKPCIENFPRYEMLYDLSEQLQTVNFILLNFNPDGQQSENLEQLAKVFEKYDPGLTIYRLDSSAPENQHPSKQFQTFSVPEFIMLDPNNKVREHFVLLDRPSFKKAMQLICKS